METSETDNPDSGTDNAQAHADDTASDWDYFDPDEDTEEAQEAEATDDGTEATDEAASTEDEAPAAEETVASPDAIVELADGKKVKVADLIQGHLRQDDYSRKTQALANDRKALQAEVQRLEGITTAIVDHFEKLVPPAPDHAVALRDPARYTREMAVHQAAMAQLQNLIEIGQKPKAIKEAVTKQENAELAREENARLIERFPEAATKQGREKFFTSAVDAAQAVGFSMTDLQGVTDHRIFAALHYAALGLKASKAMQAAKAKAEKAPPVAPQKPAAAKGRAGAYEAATRFKRHPTLRNAAAAWSGD